MSNSHPIKKSLWAVGLAGLLCLPAIAQEVATVEVFGSGAEWTVQVPHRGLVLTVSGEGHWLRTEFKDGGRPYFDPYDTAGNPLPDGIYNWELVIVPEAAAQSDTGAENGRPAARGSSFRERPVLERQAASGSFWIQGGAVVGGGAETEPEPPAGPGPAGEGPGGSNGPLPETVISGDLTVYNALCVGFDCLASESYGADSIRLKENNLRIHFDDTSSTGSFPNRDWRIVANDQANGGANKFSIEDVTGARTPFTITAGAPNHSLFLSSAGNLGLGTSTPVLDAHIVSGNTPALRLEQDGSSGFTPHTWDIAGNETSFFIRDVTSGSRLPFRIFPGAASGTLVVDSDSEVGIGTTSPSAKLHVLGTAGTTKAQIEEASTTLDNNRVLMEIVNNGRAQFKLRNSADASGSSWFVSSETNGNFGISREGTGVLEVAVTPAGDMIIQGNYTPDYVFEPDYALMPLPELAEFVARERHLPNVPNAEQVAREGINVNDFPMALLEKIEELTLYTIEQHETIAEQQAAIEELASRLTAMEEVGAD